MQQALIQLLKTAICFMLAFIGACATSPEQVAGPLKPLVFPPPPDEPRFIFERTVLSSADLEVSDRQTRLRRMLTGESASGTGFAKPFDVSVCQGKIYVSDTVRRRVLAFDVQSRRFFEIGNEDPGFLRKPLGLDNDNECNLYVADATTRQIAVYDQSGNFLRAIGGIDWFERLSHVAVDSSGAKLFVVDTGGVNSPFHGVRVFDAQSGAHLYDIGGRGDAAGKFNLPRDAVIGPDGLLYVVDGGNFRVQVFQQDGSFVRSFGSIGRQYGQFSRPKGVSIDPEGNSYVSDAAHGNFQIFDRNGQLLLFVGDRSEQSGRAKYMLPAGIDVDEDGRVYMVDQFYRKLDIYRPAHLAATDGYLGAWADEANE